MREGQKTLYFTPSQIRKIDAALCGIDYFDKAYYTEDLGFGILFSNSNDAVLAKKRFPTVEEAKQWLLDDENIPRLYHGGIATVFNVYLSENIYEKNI